MLAIFALVIGAAAAWAGLWFPDVDLRLGLGHRSALTHSLLAPLLLMLVARREWQATAAAGLALGIGVHCAADLFPRAMWGLATVKLPFAGSIGAAWSYVWLGITAFAGIVVPLRLVAARHGAAALGLAATATLLAGAGYVVLHDEPLLTAGAVGGALAVAHPAGRRRVLAGLQRWRNARS